MTVTMATYYPITAEEMHDFLTERKFVKLDPSLLPGTLETVYSKRVPHDKFPLTLRVYTGIVDGESRGVGQDAIRVTLFMRVTKRDGTKEVVKISGDTRVHRVEGWKANLQNRLDNWGEQMPTEFCHKCGAPKVLRKKRGKEPFMGCAAWFLHDDKTQVGQQAPQEAPQATQPAPEAQEGELRVVSRQDAVATLVRFLQGEADLNDLAATFSLHVGQKVVVKDADGHHSDCFLRGEQQEAC